MPRLTDERIHEAVAEMLRALPFEGTARRADEALDQGVPVEGRPILLQSLRTLQEDLNLYPSPEEWDTVRTAGDLTAMLMRVRRDPNLEDRRVKPVLSFSAQRRLAAIAAIILLCAWLLIVKRC